MNSFWKRIADAFYPEGITCDLCDAELVDNDDRKLGLCASCYGQLKKVKTDKERIGGCDVLSLYEYDSVRDLILRSKDNDMPYLTKTIARLLARYYKSAGLSVDAVTYVPCSKKNLKRRGYDHMRYVAEEFCALTGLTLSDALRRVKETADQTQVDADKRYENVRGGFVCASESLQGTRVLLIDDLVTTGATLSACIAALRSAYPEQIVCLTLGRSS